MTHIFEIGSIVCGRYTLKSVLGIGGMGSVYRAFDATLGHDVALKFPVTSINGNDRSAYIVREHATLNRFNHPSIPKVYHQGATDDGTAFLSMELIEGCTLKSLIGNRSLPPMPDRVRWLGEIAEALMHIHDKGLVYCDLKPDNVMICDASIDGPQVKLVDFGIAKLVGEESKDSKLAAGGTTEYMSPEQHKGRALDLRSDVYSFGVLGFELCTGQRPFDCEQDGHNDLSERLKLSNMHMGASVPSPRSINPEVPKDLSAILEVCLEKRRKDRFASMREVHANLGSVDGSSLLTHLLRALVAKVFPARKTEEQKSSRDSSTSAPDAS